MQETSATYVYQSLFLFLIFFSLYTKLLFLRWEIIVSSFLNGSFWQTGHADASWNYKQIVIADNVPKNAAVLNNFHTFVFDKLSNLLPLYQFRWVFDLTKHDLLKLRVCSRLVYPAEIMRVKTELTEIFSRSQTRNRLIKVKTNKKVLRIRMNKEYIKTSEICSTFV